MRSITSRALRPLIFLVPASLAVGSWLVVEQAKLMASDAMVDDQAGWSVSLDGDRALVGAIYAHNGTFPDSGAAYVFARSGTTWTEEAKLTAAEVATYERMGHAVALSGDTAVVTAPDHDFGGGVEVGAAFVFVRSGTTWTQQAKLVASDAASQAYFGSGVDIEGDTIVVGADGDNGAAINTGAAYVFTRSGTTWTEEAKLVASGLVAGDGLGTSVALDGNAVLVGAAGGKGAAYVFVRIGATWTEHAKLIASDGQNGDSFGYSVALSVQTATALVGAPTDDYPGVNNQGSAYVFVRSGSVWSEQAKLVASNPTAYADFGLAVSLEGDTAAIGAPWAGTSSSDGTVTLFARTGTVWTEELEFTSADQAGNDNFGYSLDMLGGELLVGARKTGPLRSGGAYVYLLGPPPVSYCTAGTSASGCLAALSASGTPSATASSGFTLQAAGVEGQKDGLFFFGTNGRQANTWGNGTSYQCVVPPVVRGGLLAGVGTAGQCDGAFAQDLNALWCPTCPKPAKNPGVGATVQGQLWYRDPFNTSNQTTSLSNAIEFLVGP